MKTLIFVTLIICGAVAQLHTREYDLDGTELPKDIILAQWAKEYYPEESDLEASTAQPEQQLAVVAVASADGEALEPTVEVGETLVNKKTSDVEVQKTSDVEVQKTVELSAEEQQEIFYKNMEAEQKKAQESVRAQEEQKLKEVENSQAEQVLQMQSGELGTLSDEEKKQALETKSLEKAENQEQQNIQVEDSSYNYELTGVENGEPLTEVQEQVAQVEEPVVAASGEVEIVAQEPAAVEQPTESKVDEPLVAESGDLEIVTDESQNKEVPVAEVKVPDVIIPANEQSGELLSSEVQKDLSAESGELLDSPANDSVKIEESGELVDTKADDQTLQNTQPQQTLVQGKCIIVYSQCQYKGDSMEVCHSLKDIEAFNHDIQSIYIPKGLGLTVFDGENFEGKKHKYTESQACLNEPISFAQIQMAPKMSYNLRAKL